MNRPDFPNSFDAIQEADSSFFEPCPYEDLMDWKVGGWELPGNVDCIIRAEDVQTKKIKEHVYRTQKGAENCIKRYARDARHNVTIADSDAISYFRAELFETLNKVKHDLPQEVIDEMDAEDYSNFLAQGDEYKDLDG